LVAGRGSLILRWTGRLIVGRNVTLTLTVNCIQTNKEDGNKKADTKGYKER
jgi:hypothetical protein